MIETFLLKLKQADTPVLRLLKRGAQALRNARLPVPRFALPLFGFLFYVHSAVLLAGRMFISFFYVEPVFRGRCESLGKRFQISKIPFIVGPTVIRIGDDVRFFGKVDIFSGRILENPTLIIRDRVDIGHNVVFVVNKEIVIEEDVNVASGVRFMDSDAHPRDTAERIADLGPRPEEIKPVRIGRYAWIGQNSFILKGVTIGEGAIIGVNSVVVTDIPPYSVAMGNPARVVVKQASKPPGSTDSDQGQSAA